MKNPLAVAAILVGVFSSSSVAIGGSPFRLEGAFVTPKTLRVSGMVDFTRWLSARLCLVSVRLPPNFSVSLALPSGADAFSVDFPDQACLICSPWRGRLKVQPYVFAGLGFGYAQYTDPKTDSGFSILLRTATYGVGVEPLMFFLPRAPALFLEAGQAFYQEALSFLPGQRVNVGLHPVSRVAVGLRI
jgi:hypothetical protein